MKYGPLCLIPWIFYPFALRYLRTGEIHRDQLIAMVGVVIAIGPRLLALWTCLIMSRLFQDGWLLLWMVGLTVWLFRHRTAWFHPEFNWGENPRTPVERLAASVAVVMLVGLLVLAMLDVS